MTEPIVPLPPRESLLRHKRERNLQVLLPIILAVILIVTAAVLVVIATSNNADVERWSAIALTCLVVPIMMLTLIVLIILSVMIWGAGKVYSNAPEYSGQAIDILKTASVQVKHYSDRAAGPFLAIKTWLGVPNKLKNKE
jgi:predicted PurR-regulated permease PerM